ncbi:MAG TPA: lactate utilization protein B [Myxococcota bacterium]|nr:lactate utilization protein B [Myxococcota bacterium]
MSDHPAAAARFTADEARAHWHDEALWFVREKRDRAARALPEWEALRDCAAAIKAHTLDHLAWYLAQFEAAATARGAHVHWARDAAEHNQIVHALLAERFVTRTVKSKSMLTEECGLNAYLGAHGIEVVDTDLGERIVQLRREPPSHIVFPAIHLKRGEIGDLFHRELGSAEGLADPTALTAVAREHLRAKFLGAQAGLTGVNFAIAQTGGIVVCTNEGNADLGTALPPLHIACFGIEKLIPRLEHLPVFVRLLARSATGQAITAYTSHFHGPRPGGELHLVIVDNGRSRLLADRAHRGALACIRCGACMNTCPVYRRSGGHSYAAVVPGPIGSILEPARDPVRHASLPFACSLCASCSDVCPVRIDLHHQLLAWRGELLRAGHAGRVRRWLLGAAGLVLRSPRATAGAGALARAARRLLPERWLARAAGGWTRERALPDLPRASFRAEWRRQRGR